MKQKLGINYVIHFNDIVYEKKSLESRVFSLKERKKNCRYVTSHPPAACRASCPCEGGDGAADGWEDKRKAKKASGKIREWGTARVSTVRREIDTTIFLRG